MSSSKSHKRSWADSDDTDMTIKTAHGEPLHADSHILRALSSCAKQLPPDATEWDVSGFLHNEEPFAQATVKCWLSCALTVLNGTEQLDEDDKAQLSTAKGLHAVLSFAHAVGSRTSVFTAACSQLGSLQIVVQLQEEQTVELDLSCQRNHWFRREDRRLCIEGQGSELISQPLTDQEQQQCRRQVAEQVSMLLHMAHVLQLQPLLQAVNDFVFFNHQYSNSILYGALKLVFTEEVLSTVLGSGTISKEAYVSSVLSRPGSFVRDQIGHAGLLKPGTERFICDEDTGKQRFQARMLQDFAGFKAGDKVGVTLALFEDVGMTLRSGEKEVWLPAQLLLGQPVTDREDWDEYMSSNLAQS